MKKLFQLGFLLFCTSSLYAQQPINGDERNVLAWFSSIYLNTDDFECPNFTNSLRRDLAGGGCNAFDEYKCLMQRNGSTQQIFSTNGNAPGEVEVGERDWSVMDQNDVSDANKLVDFRINIWEDDDGNNTYNSSIDDWPCGNNTMEVDVFASTIGKTELYELVCDDNPGFPENSGDLVVASRYSFGDDIANSLNFGALTAGANKAHQNRVIFWEADRPLPNNYNAELEYTNAINSNQTGFNNNPEIVYKFNIGSITACLTVAIQAEFTFTAGDGPGFKVAKLSGNNIDEFLFSKSGAQSDTRTYSTGTYAVIVESNSDKIFDLTIEPTWNPIVPGVIGFSGDLIGPEGYNPPVISNTTSASGSYDTYQWEINAPGSGWEEIPGATSSSYNPGPLNSIGLYSFRRAAINNACPGVDEYSNILSIEILAPLGDVSGFLKVDDGMTNNCIGAGIENADITITNLEPLPGGVAIGDITENITTNSQGNFNFPNFYIGDEATDWRVTASFFDHEITPEEYIIQLSSNNPDVSGLCFEDAETFTLSGKVYHDYEGNECGMNGVEVILKDNSDDVFAFTTSDLDGTYALSVPFVGDWTIEAILEGHTFDQLDPLYVIDDQGGLDIEDLTFRQFSVSFQGGCENIIGSLSFNLVDSSGCDPILVETNAITGLDVLNNIPAKQYNIQNAVYTHPAGASTEFINTFIKADIEAYVNNLNISIDLTEEDSSLVIVYHPDPVLEVQNLPEPPSCTQTVVGANVPYGVVGIDDVIELTLVAWDIPPGLISANQPGCPLDTGLIIVENNVGSFDQFPLVDSLVVDSLPLTYFLQAGAPNIASPFNKSLVFNLKVDSSSTTQYIYSLIAEGVRPRENNFTTVSPSVPLHILRDPPGDASFSKITTSSSQTVANSFSSSVGGGLEVSAKATYEKEIAIIDTKIYGEIGGSIGISGALIDSETEAVTSTLMDEFSTFDAPGSIGVSADVYVGAAYNIIFALSDVIRLNESTCEVLRTADLVVNPDAFATTYIFTENSIRNSIIPDLRLLAENPATSDEDRQKYEDQITIWEELIYYNDKLKNEAQLIRNISTSAGANFSSSESITNSSSRSAEWTTSFDASIFASGGISVFGVGGEASIEARLNLTSSGDETVTSDSTFTVEYTIADDDTGNSDPNGPGPQGDAFTIDIKEDRLYGTPVFDALASKTSCPYEPGSLPRHDAVLTALPNTQFDVPSEEGADFTLTISNVSQSGERMVYFVEYLEFSNPDSPDVNTGTIGGGQVTLDFGESFTFNGINIKPNANNGVYSYEGIEFRVYAGCSNSTGFSYVPDESRTISSTLLNVYFIPPCSDVTLASPSEEWVSSTAINNELPIHITDYDLGSGTIDNLRLEYKAANSSTWTLAQQYDISSLNGNSSVGSNFNWNTDNLADGLYKIRLTLECGDDQISTVPIGGVIDKTPPRKIGFPDPASRRLESIDDIIGITFNEDIDPSTDFNNVEIINQLTGNPVQFEVSVIENELIIFPLVDLTQLPAAVYKIVYSGIKDLYGNELEAPLEWTFNVGEVSIFDCDENTVFYVDKNVPPGGRNNGLSWEDAFYNLTDAMNLACPGSKIYVAEGMYYPTDYLYPYQSTVLDSVPGDEVYLDWKREFSWYGGFPTGGGEFEDRNAELYPTIISGDANKDGIKNDGDCHNLLKIQESVTGRMEGFILENSYNNAPTGLKPGAVYNKGDITIVNCIFKDNETTFAGNDAGGAIHNDDASAIIVNSIFANNVSQVGSAIFELGDSEINSEIINCVFFQNSPRKIGAVEIVVKNSIFSDLADPVGNIHISYSSYHGNNFPSFVSDEGNNIFNNDPSFVDPANGDFRLSSNSSCKDTGNKDFVLPFSNTDLAYNPRVINTDLQPDGQVDMGAYELGPCGDLTDETRLYVDQSASSEGDGYSWNSPFLSLTTALLKASSCGIDTVLVAQGVYYPGTDGTTDRLSTFTIPSGMYLAGGYPSGGGLQNSVENETILSGNIGNEINTSDNVYHVITIPTTHRATTIEGFTIMEGNADAVGHQEGGGILHTASGYGILSKPIIRDCIIKSNKAIQGGGIANIGDDLADASIQLINSTIRNNSASLNGGGIFDKAENTGVSQMSVINCVIYENNAQASGGGIYQLADNNSQVQGTVRNSTIVNNSCAISGGGLHMDVVGSGVVGSKVYNSILYGNQHQTNVPDQIFQSANNSLITLKNNNIEGGYGSPELMALNFDTIPYFVGAHVGNFELDACSPLLDKGDDVEISMTSDRSGNPRKVGKVDIGAFEYDGFSRRGNLPETLDDIVLNCVKEATIPIPSDGITYAIYNDTLTVLLAGPVVGDEEDKYITTNQQILSDTTLKVIVGRDASYGVDLNSGNGYIEFASQSEYNFSDDMTFKFNARINPNSSSQQTLYQKEANLTIDLDNSSLTVTTTNGNSATLDLGIQLGVWQDLSLEYTPISATQALLIGTRNGVEISRELMTRNSATSTLPLRIGGSSTGTFYTGMLDYIGMNFNEQSIIQLDFLSAKGSDKAFDMRLAASGGAAQEGLLTNLDRYEVWLEGEDSYVKLCPDTLVLNVIVDPSTKIHFVESHLDEGYKSLRGRVEDACPLDTIRFANILMGDTVKFESEILLDKDLFIEGLGMNGGTTLDGQEFTRLFNIQPNTSITYKDLQMIKGYHPITGGATPISSDCTLWNVRFKDNTSGGQNSTLTILPFSNLNIKGEVILNE